MLLQLAIKLLVNKDVCKSTVLYAGKLLKKFVKMGERILGPQFVVFNIHNLVHLSNDVMRHGSLDAFSAFPFENKLQKLKNLLRKSGKALEQIVRRLSELENAKFLSPLNNVTMRGKIELFGKH